MSLYNYRDLLSGRASLLALSVALLGSATFALAQTTTPNSDSNGFTTVLDPIIITARKTDERLQDVPESITVVSPEDLAATPFASAPAIAHNSPNVQWIDSGAGQQFFSIRGVSTLGRPLNFSDGTVGFSVDGVPHSMMSASGVLLDVNRVEVMRGPQGTLWGTNALGGAINVVTNQPDGQREIRLTTEIGSNGYRMGEAILGGNIIPGTLDGRMAVRFGRQDGDISSLFTDDLGKREISAFRGGLRFTGLDNTTITLSGSYLREKNNAPVFVLRDAPGFPVSGVLAEPSAKTTHGDATLTIEHDFDLFRFTSISAYQRNESDRWASPSDTLVPGMPVVPPGGTVDKENIYSQELRLSSFEDDPIRWVLGASVVHTEGSRLCSALQCAFPPNTTTATIDSTNFGLFGDMTIPFGERWEVSAGARLSHDNIRAGLTNALNLPGLAGTNSTSQTYPTGRLALSYLWTDDIRTYVSVSRGHSSRVYSLLPRLENGVLPDPHPAATGWTYEAGVKANLFDDRLQIDANVFHNDIKNGLLAYLDPQALAIQTTFQDYTSTGFELQARAQVTESLSLIGGVGYTHSRLGVNGANYALVTGNRVPNTPDWTFTTALQYDAPGSVMNLPGEFSFNLQYQFNGSRSADPEASFNLKPYHMVNARLGWQNDGGDFEIYAFGRNLLDERIESFGANLLGSQVVNVGQGRTIGVGLTKAF